MHEVVIDPPHWLRDCLPNSYNVLCCPTSQITITEHKNHSSLRVMRNLAQMMRGQEENKYVNKRAELTSVRKSVMETKQTI